LGAVSESFSKKREGGMGKGGLRTSSCRTERRLAGASRVMGGGKSKKTEQQQDEDH